MPDPLARHLRFARRVAAGLTVVTVVTVVMSGLGGCVASRSSDWAQTAPAIPPVRHARNLPATDDLFVTRRDRTAARPIPTAAPARN